MRLYALALLLALDAQAQENSAKSNTPEAPAAVPARPTVTTPATLPPVGYLQFEQGFNQANSSPGLGHQFSLVQNTKLAVHPHLLLQVIDQPFARTQIPPPTRDTGDLILGAQILLTPAPGPADPNKPAKPFALSAVALAYNGRVRTGTAPDLDIGSFSQGLILQADGTVPGLTFQTNFLLNEQKDDSSPARRAQLGQTLSLTRQFNPRYALTAELWHVTQPFVSTTRQGSPISRANAVGLLITGGLTLRPNLVFDAGFDRGLTSTSTAWQTFAGFTYLLPHRLWPKRNP